MAATPLSVAAEEDHVKVLELLIKSGRDGEKVTNRSGSPVMLGIVVWKGQNHVAESLLKGGCDTSCVHQSVHSS